MATVTAFGTLANTIHAGLTAYFRATGCTALTIADVLPLLSKITAYEEEYVIGEMLIWDSGLIDDEPNNCTPVQVMVYTDGWIVAWFDKEAQNQGSTSGLDFVDSQTINGFGAFIKYQNQFNGCLLEVESSSPTDSECPDGTRFCIREANYINQSIKVHEDLSPDAYHFNIGHDYQIGIYHSNGNLVWWGNAVGHSTAPSNLSNRLYRAIYEMWENLRYSSNATDATDTAVTKAFLDDGGVFTDYTTEFNNTGANDVELIPAVEEIDDAFYYGSSNKFRGLNLNIGTAGVGNTIVWEYWDGSAWSSLIVTDNTVGFTVLGENTVTFTPYIDWAKCFVNSSEQYWIRSRVSVAAFTTQPLLTQGWIIVSDSLLYFNSNLGMYSFEDTAANYCLLCGIEHHITVGTHGDSTSSKYFYNTTLPGKLIYSHSISHGFRGSGSGVYGWNTYCWLYINGKQIYYRIGGSSVQYYSPGYRITNIELIDTSVAFQNVFKVKNRAKAGYSASGYSASYFATVLITS